MAGTVSAPTEVAAAPTDEALARRFVIDGDSGAVEELIQRYAPRLRHLAIALVGPDETRIADLEQEVFITLLRRIQKFQGRSSFGTFFFRVARNRMLDLIRSDRRYGNRVIAFAQPDLSASAHAGPEDQFVRGEQTEMVRKAMKCLKPQDQLLLYLKDGEGEGITDLCAMTGMPAGTIKSRLARCRKKVARALEELGYEQ